MLKINKKLEDMYQRDLNLFTPKIVKFSGVNFDHKFFDSLKDEYDEFAKYCENCTNNHNYYALIINLPHDGIGAFMSIFVHDGDECTDKSLEIDIIKVDTSLVGPHKYSTLFEKAEEYSRTLDCKSISTKAFHTKADFISLLEKQGFEKSDYGNTEYYIHMVKPIKV